MAIGRVRLLGSLIIVSAQTYSSQAAKNVKILTVAKAGLDSGKINLKKRLKDPAPSIIIASSNSHGISSKKPLSKKVLKARFVAT